MDDMRILTAENKKHVPLETNLYQIIHGGTIETYLSIPVYVTKITFAFYVSSLGPMATQR